MKLFTHIDNTVNVTIGNKDYPVTITGSGKPLLSIGIGLLGQRTLSEQFKQNFQVFSSNFYWVKESSLTDFRLLTIEQIIDDIADLANSLNLPQFFIFGHSAYGIVALEFAKKYPNRVLGIIMSGTPPNCNAEVEAINNDYFEKHADVNRKIIDVQRREQFAKEDLQNLSVSDRFLKKYIWRDAPRYWHIPDFDCSDVWHDIILDDVIDYFFSVIMPNVDVKKDLEKVNNPIFLAAGNSDYDCCPFLWRYIENLPKRMVISEFKNSGHWPHYEEHELFDQRIENWLNQLRA
jgi:proline iminopeptidase